MYSPNHLRRVLLPPRRTCRIKSLVQWRLRSERVASLQKDYRQRIAEAEAPAEKERIVAEAHNEFTKAVTEQSLSVEEYASILDMAQDDHEIREKLLQRIRPSDK